MPTPAQRMMSAPLARALAVLLAEYRVLVEQRVTVGDFRATRGRLVGATPDGRPVDVAYLAGERIREGRATTVWQRLDLEAFVAQVGASHRRREPGPVVGSAVGRGRRRCDEAVQPGRARRAVGGTISRR